MRMPVDAVTWVDAIERSLPPFAPQPAEMTVEENASPSLDVLSTGQDDRRPK
jgi:hypothetical protein